MECASSVTCWATASTQKHYIYAIHSTFVFMLYFLFCVFVSFHPNLVFGSLQHLLLFSGAGFAVCGIVRCFAIYILLNVNATLEMYTMEFVHTVETTTPIISHAMAKYRFFERISKVCRQFFFSLYSPIRSNLFSGSECANMCVCVLPCCWYCIIRERMKKKHVFSSFRLHVQRGDRRLSAKVNCHFH